MSQNTASWRLPVIAIALLGLLAAGFFLHWEMPRVQIAPEALFHIGGFTITNTILSGWITTLVLLVLFIVPTRRLRLVPGRLQGLAELVVETFLGLCVSVASERHARRFLPLVLTIFLFVLTANWMGLLPGFGTIGVWREHEVAAVEKPAGQAAELKVAEKPAAAAAAKAAAAKEGEAKEEHAEEPELELVPLFRGATTDLNTTLALALISVVATQYYGIRTLGAGAYLSKFFNVRGGFIGLFVGLLELVGEVSRILSFSFRLFGNIFAGEVLLAVVGFLVPLVATLPFLGLELFVGVVQAFIFSMLTLVFMTIATIGHGEPHEEAAEHGH